MTDSENNQCPFCNVEDGCEHLLLSVDVTFREATGGELYDEFNKRWSDIWSEHGEDDDFDEREEFESLLGDVDSYADAMTNSSFEGGPGQSSAYQNYYCKTPKAIDLALTKFKEDL